MTSEEPESLRERNVRERRIAIHRAAVNLVLENGLDNVTVAQIAERSHVSNRTFFNYFRTKEMAILGLADLDRIGTNLTAFILAYEPVREDLAEDLTYVIRAAFECVLPPWARKQKVRAIQSQYPHLAMLSMETMRHYDEAIVRGVCGRLARRGIKLGDEESAFRSAQMMTQLCAVPMQHVFRTIKFNTEGDLTEEQVDRVFDTSVQLFRTILERLK